MSEPPGDACRGWEQHIHLIRYSLSISSALSAALVFEAYQNATFAPASANACTTAKPTPLPPDDTMAVFPCKKKRGSTRSHRGGIVAAGWKLALVSVLGTRLSEFMLVLEVGLLCSTQEGLRFPSNTSRAPNIGTR